MRTDPVTLPRPFHAPRKRRNLLAFATNPRRSTLMNGSNGPVAPGGKRAIREDKLLETAAKISTRIQERFPGSGLTQVAREIIKITEEALVRARKIRRPDYRVLAGQALLAV